MVYLTVPFNLFRVEHLTRPYVLLSLRSSIPSSITIDVRKSEFATSIILFNSTSKNNEPFPVNYNLKTSETLIPSTELQSSPSQATIKNDYVAATEKERALSFFSLSHSSRRKLQTNEIAPSLRVSYCC